MSPCSPSDISKSNNEGKQGTKRHKSRCIGVFSILFENVIFLFAARTCQNQLSGPLLLANGNYVPRKDRYNIGEIVRFTCNGGFDLHGSEFVSCKRTGIWSSFAWPRCIGSFLPFIIVVISAFYRRFCLYGLPFDRTSFYP